MPGGDGDAVTVRMKNIDGDFELRGRRFTALALGRTRSERRSGVILSGDRLGLSGEIVGWRSLEDPETAYGGDQKLRRSASNSAFPDVAEESQRLIPIIGTH